MTLDRATLTRIVEQASTVTERLNGAFIPLEDDTGAGPTRLAAWRLAVAEGDNARFARRLEWDGLNTDSASALLGRVALADDRPLPVWTEILAEACAEALVLAGEIDDDAHVRDRVLRERALIAFEELLVPFVRCARTRLRKSRGGDDLGLMTGQASADLERGLLTHLSTTAELALTVELQAFRALRPTRLADILSAVSQQARPAYAAFVRGQLTAGLETIVRRYPVLARLLAASVESWLRTSSELLSHLAADATVIQRELTAGEAVLPIARATPAGSDRHRGGHSVTILVAACGVRVVYKPRPLDLESRYSRLLEWLNAREPDALALHALRVLDRGSYGWEEYAVVRPCLDAAEVERFYERAGMMLCLTYVLGGSDLHCGNLLASGEHPVIIDLEMLMCAPVRGADGAQSATTAHAERDTWESVLRTMLIPIRNSVDFGQGTEVYGLASLPADATTSEKRWHLTNTDLMEKRVETTPARPRGNVPSLGGVEAHAADHAAALDRGLRSMYATIVRHRDALGAPDGPLAPFERCLVRVLMRATIVYDHIVRHSLHPSFLRNGADRSIVLERTLGPATRGGTQSRYWALWIAERDQLEQLDVPIFHHWADGTSVTSWPATEVADVIGETGYAGMRARLARLDAADLEAQAHAVRLGFGVRESRAAPPDPRLARGLAAAGSLDALTAELALEEAEIIARALDRRAVESRNDGPAWVALFDLRGTSHRFPLRTLGPSLFDGQTGVGLFYAALYSTTRKPEYRQRATAIYQPIVATMSDDARRARMAASIGIGGGVGLGSIVYAVTTAATLLGEPALLAVAAAAAREISPERVASDEKLDIMFGSAGAALGLLALHRATNDPEHLERARRCGAQLLAKRTRDPQSGLLAWRTLEGEHTTSFSHGAAGIGYALLMLHRATGDAEFLDAALESRAFEDSLYVPMARNWRERPLRADESADTSRLMRSWCHGSPGIALARVAAADVVSTSAAAPGVAASVQTIVELGSLDTDFLCCGTLGRIELLSAVAQRFDRPDLRTSALAVAGQVVHRARLAGTYVTGVDESFAPTLFQGVSGIGYQLLRLTHADRVPSVLQWA